MFISLTSALRGRIWPCPKFVVIFVVEACDAVASDDVISGGARILAHTPLVSSIRTCDLSVEGNGLGLALDSWREKENEFVQIDARRGRALPP